jgi:hypothetical protein
MYSELKTTDLNEVEMFVRQHSADLDEQQISLRKKDGLFLAECYRADEPAT